MLLDIGTLGFDSFTASDRLLRRGKIAATPMRHWGQMNGDRFVRFDHEHFDERVREAGVFRHGVDHPALIVEHQFHFRQIEHELDLREARLQGTR